MGIMSSLFSIMLGIVMLVLVLFTIIGFVMPMLPIEMTVHSYEGDIKNVQFIGGGFFSSPKTIVQLENGKGLIFEAHHPEIQIGENITLNYRENKFETKFFDSFIVNTDKRENNT